MNPKNLSEDYYFNSVKKFFIPFILLNLVSIVLGASAVNILNIHIRSKAVSPAEKLAEFLPQDNLESEGIELTETQFKQSGSEKPNELILHSDLTTTDTYLISEGTSIQSDGSPELSQIQKLQILEKAFQSDHATEMDKVTTSDSLRISINNQAKDSAIIEIKREPETRQLILPTLDVTSEILDIPIVDGNWDISQIEDNSGILDGFASSPSDTGALVIVAHATTDWPIAGPFAELRTMNLGDPIIFQIGTTAYIYEISRFFRVSTSDVNILNKNGEDGIVLVTCGSYNYFTGEYGSRLVVYGDLIEIRETVAQTSD